MELNIKEAALKAAVDICLKRIRKSPERCARNLMELGISAYPDQQPVIDRHEIRQNLLHLCKCGEPVAVKEYFFNCFSPENDR